MFIEYLRDFGLQHVLRPSANFRHFATQANMTLDGPRPFHRLLFA